MMVLRPVGLGGVMVYFSVPLFPPFIRISGDLVAFLYFGWARTWDSVVPCEGDLGTFSVPRAGRTPIPSLQRCISPHKPPLLTTWRACTHFPPLMAVFVATVKFYHYFIQSIYPLPLPTHDYVIDSCPSCILCVRTSESSCCTVYIFPPVAIVSTCAG